jgi:hypothetical protein
MAHFARGAEAGPPPGKIRRAATPSHRLLSKGTRARRYPFVSPEKVDSLAVSRSKVPVGSGETTAYFGDERGPTLAPQQ